MKTHLAWYSKLTAITLIALFLPHLSCAETASGYLLMPLAGSTYKCASQGDKTYHRLLDALKTAQTTADTMLPPAVWKLLTPPPPDQLTALSAADAAACEALIGFYNKPDFKTNFRQMLITLMTGSYVSDCIVEQPVTEDQISAAFIEANKRNGLPIPDVKALTETLREKKKQANSNHSNQANQAVSVASCQEVIHFLASSDFDNMFSEAAVRKLFSDL